MWVRYKYKLAYTFTHCAILHVQMYKCTYAFSHRDLVRWQFQPLIASHTHRAIKLYSDSNRPNVAKAATSYDLWYFIIHLIKPVHPYNQSILFYA